MSEGTGKLVAPRVLKGFRDLFAEDLDARSKMIRTITEVYRLFGFEPLETPALEYVDVLGKFLPDSDRPDAGIFALRDEGGQWIGLRYDLTVPLARVVAQYGQDLPSPFRRYQVSPVWRQEKPGPGRFREFYQCDFDTVGTASMAADAEVAAVLLACFDALGFQRGEYQIRINNRKVLNGILDAAGLPEDGGNGLSQRLSVLRAIDKLDRLGIAGVRELLGEGRKDESGDFTRGARLSPGQADLVLAFVQAQGADREAICAEFGRMVGESRAGREGVQELLEIHELLAAMGIGPDQVAFDPGIVRGLEYYTGPVFETFLRIEAEDETGQVRPVGSVASGGRYDYLVQRFLGKPLPATGASIGVDRLLAALKYAGRGGGERTRGPVVVTILDPARLLDYQQMVAELRRSGIAAELYLGTGGFKAQLRYADRRRSPAVVLAGGDEFARGEVSVKDMRLGAALAGEIQDRQTWRKGQPAQISVPRGELVAAVRRIVERE